MSLRLINVVLPAQTVDELVAAEDGVEILSRWVQPLTPETELVSLFVRTEHTEPILDRLQERFGWQKDFRVVLLPVEATLPRIEEAPPEPETPVPPPEPAKPTLPARISREELLTDLNDGIRVSAVFVVMAALSAIVAAIGLTRDNVAALIGAMVIAPLLTPNAALALAATLGDFPLGRRALTANVAGSGVALLMAVAIGFLLPFDPKGYELSSRTAIGLGDVALALAAGVAGALAYTTGVASGLIGVMVAVALVPPIVAAGLLLGAGEFALAGGAFLLLAANVICINLAGVVTFLVQGIRPRAWWEADRARRASLTAAAVWAALLALLVGVLVFAQLS